MSSKCKPVICQISNERMHSELQKMIEDAFTVLWANSEDLESKKEEVVGIICTDGLAIMDRQVLDQFPALKMISNCGVGYDHIDLSYCASRGIKVYNTPRVLEDATADMGFALLLASARRIREGDLIARGPATESFDMNWFGYEVSGSTLGIVGMGRIGCKVAKRALGFGMKVLYNKRQRQDESVERALSAEYCPSLLNMLPRCDFVMLIIPGTKENEKMFSIKQFQAMKSTAVFVNIGRGSVVDQEALAAALRDGTIAAAGIDVTTPEPLPRDHPLLELSNLTISPHVGSVTMSSCRRMTQLAIDNAFCGIEGKPSDCEIMASN